MGTPTDTESSGRKELQRKLIELREEHRDLDQAITALTEDVGSPTGSNQIRIQRLKKRKLQLRDMIEKLRSELLPDISHKTSFPVPGA